MEVAQAPRRLLARRRRPAAPRHGQEDQGGDGRPARALRRGRGRARPVEGARPTRSSTCSRKFADYGFNKSHAAAYALVAYQTAYLKANHPVEFLAASMTLDLDNTDKLARIPPRGAAPRHPRRAALDQPLGRRLRRRHERGGAIRYALAADQGRRPRRPSRRSSRRAATRRSRDLADFARRINPRARQQAHAREP